MSSENEFPGAPPQDSELQQAVSRPPRRRSQPAPESVAVAESTAPPQSELDSMQREFLNTLNSLLIAVHEVVYTANLLEDDVVDSHPELKDHVTAVKKLGKIAWRFQKLARRVAARGATQ